VPPLSRRQPAGGGAAVAMAVAMAMDAPPWTVAMVER
jgi:hypothetical protein